MTSFTACTATSVSLSKDMETIRSLNLEVKSSSFPRRSSHEYSGVSACRQRRRTSPTCEIRIVAKNWFVTVTQMYFCLAI